MPDRFDPPFDERLEIEFFDLEAIDAELPETGAAVGEPRWMSSVQAITERKDQPRREPPWLPRARAVLKVAGPLAAALIAVLGAAHEIHDAFVLFGLGGFLALLAVGSFGY